MTSFTIVLAVLVALTDVQLNVAANKWWVHITSNRHKALPEQNHASVDNQPNVAKPYYSDEEIDSWKDPLLTMILNAKNYAFEQVQYIGMSGSTNTDKFINSVNEIVEKAWYDMEILNKESANPNIACDKMCKDSIENNGLKTIDHYQNCVLKVVDDADWELRSMSSDGSILTKEILAAKSVDEELQRRTVEFDARTLQFAKHMQKLEKCNTQSNYLRLKRQISEALASYTQCLKK